MLAILGFTKWCVRVVLILAGLICAYATITEATIGNWEAASYMGFATLAIGFGTISYFTRGMTSPVQPASKRAMVARLGLFWSTILIVVGVLIYLYWTHARI